MDLRPRLRGGLVSTILAALGAALMTGSVLAARSASVADLTLSAVDYAHADQTSTGTLSLTVTDTGSPADGWNVTISSSAFAYAGTNNGSSIAAANFRIEAANGPTVVSGQAIDPTGGPKVPTSGATGTLEVARKVLQADAGFGVGTYEQELGVALTIPGQSRAGTYTATLSVTIAAGP